MHYTIVNKRQKELERTLNLGRGYIAPHYLIYLSKNDEVYILLLENAR